MKRLGFLAVVFAVVFSINFASAQTVCSDSDQLMFKISGTTNAHAEVWDGMAYTEEMCFNDFFNGDYAGGNVHTDAGGGVNEIVGISSSTNAHLEGPDETGYGSGIYFGDLECQLVLNNPTCSGIIVGGNAAVRIGSLSNATNAHFLRAGLEPEYPHYLCCGSPSFGPNPETFACGDGDVDGLEECDGGVGSFTCGDVVPGSEGDLGCVPAGELGECTWDTSGCGVPNLFCEEYAFSDEGFYEFEINGEFAAPTACSDFEDISAVPEGYENQGNDVDDDLRDFKIGACNECSANYIIDSNLCGELDDCSNPSCSWNTDTDKCELSYETIGGQICSVERISESETTCAPGDVFRTVEFIDSCDPACDEPELGESCARQIPCPKVVQLPFFDSLNFVAVVLIIGLIYLAYFLKGKRK